MSYLEVIASFFLANIGKGIRCYTGLTVVSILFRVCIKEQVLRVIKISKKDSIFNYNRHPPNKKSSIMKAQYKQFPLPRFFYKK